jgi:hypothetical protein
MSTLRIALSFAAVPLMVLACGPASSQDERSTSLFELALVGRLTTDGGATRGVAWGDYDQDGDPDLALSNTADQWNALHRNDAGAFIKLTDRGRSSWAAYVAAAGRAEGVSWVDFDGDRDLDLFVATRGPQANMMFRNEGPDSLVRVTEADFARGALGASMACWADIDGDGWLDVFLAGYGGDPNRLFRNQGGTLVELVSHPLAYTSAARSCAWGDPDDDGLPDLYVGNAREPNDLFRNRGAWRFDRQTEGHVVTDVGYSYGLSWADFDGDGAQDLFVANFDTLNRIYRNDGSGSLQPVLDGVLATEEGGASKGHTWGDFDLDGRLDLFVANGTYGPDMRNFVYRGLGGGRYVRELSGAFTEHADTSAGAAWADYDRDGDLDVFVANWGSSDQINRLYRNSTSENLGRGWLGLYLHGLGANTHAWGAKVVVVANPGTGSRRMMRWHNPVTGYASRRGRGESRHGLPTDDAMAQPRHWIREPE